MKKKFKNQEKQRQHMEEVAQDNAEIVDHFFGFFTGPVGTCHVRPEDYYVWNEVVQKYERSSDERF